jgi:hypothetical protein
MSKLRRDLRIAVAGACSGLFSASMYLLAARVTTYYDYVRFRAVYGYDERYDNVVEELWWIPIVAWHVVVSIFASLVIHRYLATGRVSTFLRWQATGLVTFIGWVLTAFLAIGLECLIRGHLWPIEQAWQMVKFVPLAQFVAAVFASNVLYGTAVQAAAAESLTAHTQINESEA